MAPEKVFPNLFILFYFLSVMFLCVWLIDLLNFTGMRILVNLLLDTLPMLGNVLLLCFFVFFIFGIIGVQLWAGLLRNRCYPEENFTVWVQTCTSAVLHSSNVFLLYSTSSYVSITLLVFALFFKCYSLNLGILPLKKVNPRYKLLFHQSCKPKTAVTVVSHPLFYNCERD